MDLTLTADQEDLRARARALTETIKAHEEACEAGNGLPAETLHEIADRVRELRLNAINMPAEWGGQGLSVLDQVLVQEELGRLTNALWDAVWRPANALRACTTEEGAGSDPSLIHTTAERVDRGFRIDGEKWFVTVGDVADFLIVLAMVMPEREPTLFLVDKETPGVHVLRTPRYMHTFVYEHPEFGFEDVQVPETAVLGEVGGGYDLTRDWFVEERLMIAARCVGAAERGLGAAVVKLSASEAAGRVVDRALQIHGGRGYMRENPCERLYRDLRVDRIWEGTSEIQRVIVANEVRKRGLDGILAYGAMPEPAAA